MDNGPSCGLIDKLADSNECGKAAASLGYSGSVQSGSWGHAPYGCFVGHPYDNWKYTYFNSQKGQTGRGVYKSICKGNKQYYITNNESKIFKITIQC